MAKPTTRRTMLLRRDAMSSVERDAATQTIARAVMPLVDALPAGSVLAVYAAKGSEVDPLAIDLAARAHGLRIAYPRILGRAQQLAFHLADVDSLVLARFGLREPLASAPEVALEEIGAFVVPGIAFDRQGGRIGWGHGHYDATLVHAPHALRIGLAFDRQIVDAVPREAHDIRLHHVVTETTIYRAPD